VSDVTPQFWENRMEQINFETHLPKWNYCLEILFAFEQREQTTLVTPVGKEDHNWKFSPGDLKEREYWDSYMKYYETSK
jgi:polyphosphate kinase 2 (PPK2 family)